MAINPFALSVTNAMKAMRSRLRTVVPYIISAVMIISTAFVFSACSSKNENMEDDKRDANPQPQISGDTPRMEPKELPKDPDTLERKSGTPLKEADKPKPKKNKLKLIGESSTPMLNRTEARLNNIDIASEKLNNKVVSPGEEFSFNAVVGRRTEEKGYEEAPIIIKTEDGPKNDYGVGGGICQISTTLYNAVEKAKLEVTERHVHSKNIGYVPKGDDATVSYGTADFKFVNNRQNPVVIRIYRRKKSFTVKLYEKSG